jgi:hypothetical protein
VEIFFALFRVWFALLLAPVQKIFEKGFWWAMSKGLVVASTGRFVLGLCLGLVCAASAPAANGTPDNNCVVNALSTGLKVQNCVRSYTPAGGALGLGATEVKVTLENLKRQCYSWRATVFSTLSPYVQLYAPEDIQTLKHGIAFDDSAAPDDPLQRCSHISAVTITFPGYVEWIQLFEQTPTDAAPPLTDPFAPAAAAPSSLKKLAQAVQSRTEGPGASNVQIGWSPSFNGPQKVGVYSNLQYLINIPNKNQNRNQWIGMSSLIDRDNRGAQNPDSTINTIAYMAFLPTPEHHCEEDPNPARERGRIIPEKGAKGDIFDCGRFKIRPAIVEARTGAEYALDTGALNQINSLAVYFPIALFKLSAVTLTPMFGFEAGRNFVTEANLSAPAGVFRGLTGTDGSYRFKGHPSWLLGTKPFTLSGTFRARFPATSEEFTTIYNMKNLATLSTRARIYGRAEFSVPLSRILSASAIYQYGDLPPAFLFFGHTISIALKATSPTDYEH